MSYRTEEVKTYRTFVICDDCGKERNITTTDKPIGFDGRMNGALCSGYSFTQSGGAFKNYCRDCKTRYQGVKA